MSTADSAEAWLNKRAADLRKRIEGVKASDALAEAEEAQNTAPGTSARQRAPQKATGALQAEDDAVLDAIKRINRKERAG